MVDTVGVLQVTLKGEEWNGQLLKKGKQIRRNSLGFSLYFPEFSQTKNMNVSQRPAIGHVGKRDGLHFLGSCPGRLPTDWKPPQREAVKISEFFGGYQISSRQQDTAALR